MSSNLDVIIKSLQTEFGGKLEYIICGELGREGDWYIGRTILHLIAHRDVVSVESCTPFAFLSNLERNLGCVGSACRNEDVQVGTVAVRNIGLFPIRGDDFERDGTTEGVVAKVVKVNDGYVLLAYS